MSKQKSFFSSIADERIAYRFVLSFALMGIIPMLLTIYIVVVMWLPDLSKWTQINVILLLDFSAIILGFLLSRNIVKTVLRTSQTAKEIAEGDLTKRIEIRNDHSEMGQLAQSFNQITTRLEQKIIELETSEKKYRHIVENVPDLLYYLNPAGNITSVNEEVTELLGYAKVDLIDRPFAEIVDEQDYKRYERVLRERRTSEPRLTKGVRIKLRTKQGEYRTFEINSRGIYDKGNNFVGTEGLARDITAQLALEEDREELLYMLTHDIKNPISAILFIIYMMRDGTISENKYGEYYDKIEKACNGVVRLVEGFLDYKKFEFGSVNLDKAKVDIRRLLRDVARTYNSEARAKGKNITVNGKDCEGPCANGKLVIEVDEKYFQRVIENLVTNAIKFASSRIDIGCKENETGVTLFVSDDGPGVPEEEREEIFKLFHTVTGSRTARGIGVGLASVQKIVHAHGGRLWIENGAGGGCSFLIDIPKQPAPSEVRTAASARPGTL